MIITCFTLKTATVNTVIVCLAFQSRWSTGIWILRPLFKAPEIPEEVMNTLGGLPPQSAVRARGLASATGVWLLPVHSGSSPASVLPARRRRVMWTISWCHSVLYFTAPQQHPSFQQPTWHLEKTPLWPFVLTGCNPHPLQALLFGR